MCLLYFILGTNLIKKFQVIGEYQIFQKSNQIHHRFHKFLLLFVKPKLNQSILIHLNERLLKKTFIIKK
jgi:hypothetical protein